MKLGERIKNIRKELGMSVDDLAEKLGKNRSTIYRYENGDIESLPIDILEPIAKALHTTPAHLMEWDKEDQKPKKIGVKIPVLGDVAAGIPISAVENVIGTEEITRDMAMTGEYFGLRIKGDSMAPRIQDGDVVIVRVQPDANSGDVVIVKVNGDSATCKRLKKYAEGIGLISFNPAYEPMNFTDQECIELPVTIIGKVVENRQKF